MKKETADKLAESIRQCIRFSIKQAMMVPNHLSDDFIDEAFALLSERIQLAFEEAEILRNGDRSFIPIPADPIVYKMERNDTKEK